MKTEEFTAIKSAIADVEAKHPVLYAVLRDLADELAAAEIDPDSTLAAPASALVTAFGMHIALHIQGISPIEKLVLITLADYANDAGECSPSQRAVANRCGLSRKSVNESVSKLARRGLVEIISNNGNVSTYRVKLTSAVAPHAAKGASA